MKNKKFEFAAGEFELLFAIITRQWETLSALF